MNQHNSKNLVVVFPGQGSQTLGMAKDFCENFSIARQIFEEASDTLGFNVSKLCFEGPMDQLTLTENLQPCLVTTEIAIFRSLQHSAEVKGLENTLVMAGHSLGEYSAHVAAGSLSLSQALRLTRKRGALMQQAVPAGIGAMAAIIGADDNQVLTLCALATKDPLTDVVSAANFNAPGQVVVSGHATAVSRLGEIQKSDPEMKRVKIIPLTVSAPFHCALMEPCRKGLSDDLKNTVFSAPTVDIIANLTATREKDPARFAQLLTDQITSCVKWSQSMAQVPQWGATRLLEVGPGAVLTGLMKRIEKGFPTFNISSMQQLKEINLD